MLEWTASVMIAIEPVIAPGRDLEHDQDRVGDDRDRGRALLARRLGRGADRPADAWRPPARARRASRRGPPGGAERSISARAARPRWLIASFSSGRQLGHRAPVVVVVGHEGRVVAEAAVAARLVRRACPRSGPRPPASSPSGSHVAPARTRRPRACRRPAAPRAAAWPGSPRRWRPRRRSGPSARRARRRAPPPRCPSRRPRAGPPVASAAARALPSAFSANVSPVSGGSSTSSGSGTSSCGASSAPSSRSLCALREASTSRIGVEPRQAAAAATASCWAARSCSMPAAASAEQLVERGARERRALARWPAPPRGRRRRS